LNCETNEKLDAMLAQMGQYLDLYNQGKPNDPQKGEDKIEEEKNKPLDSQ
jgi:hypothetical protein